MRGDVESLREERMRERERERGEIGRERKRDYVSTNAER